MNSILCNTNKFSLILLLISINVLLSCSNNNLSYKLDGLWKETLTINKKLTKKENKLRKFLSKSSYHYYNKDTLVFIVNPKVSEDILLNLLDENKGIPLHKNGTIFYYHYKFYKINNSFIIETKLKKNWYSDWLYTPYKQIYTLFPEKKCFIFMENSIFCKITQHEHNWGQIQCQ